LAILITGVAGLTGSYLAEKCIENGETVIGIDNLFRGTKQNLESILSHERFTFIEDDILNIHRYTEQFSNKIHEIYHLAAVVPTKYFYEEPVMTFENNCLATKIMIEWGIKIGATKFVNASSSEVYGHPQEIPTKETTPTYYDAVEITPRWSYAQGKILTEHIGNYYKDKIAICHLRYANVYGPRDIDENHVIPYILNKLIKNEEIHLNKKADTIKRTFLYMTDCANATYLAMKYMKSGISYNIGSSEEVTIHELFKTCLQVMQDLGVASDEGNIIYDIERVGDPTRRVLDITRAKQELGISIDTSLYDGIRRTGEWMLAMQNNK
jgi:nucleoside-diphosphate-sugar epimerase